MRSHKLIVILIILTLFSSVGLQLLVPRVAHASTSYTWTGNGNGGGWTNPKNWSPEGVPSSGDSVTIPSSTTDYDVDGMPQGTTLQNLTLAGSSTELDGGSLTVTGTFTWSGDGSLSTPSFTVDGTADISDNGQKILSGPCGSGGIETVTFAGSTTLSSSGLILGCANLVVPNTGTFTAQPGSMVSASACCVNPAQFINQGSVVVPATLSGTASAIISAVAFTDSGSVSIGSNSTLDLEIAPSTFASGVSFSGAGTLLIQDSATVQLSGSVNLGSGTTFQLAQGGQFGNPGTLTGNGTLSGSGSTFSWTGGTLTGNLTVANSVSTSIVGSNQKFLQSPGGSSTATLTLNGPTTFSGTGPLVLGSPGPALINNGTFSPQAGTTISAPGCCVNPAQFVNKGTLTSNVGAGNTFTISLVSFMNSGTVDLKSGTLQFGGPNYTQTAGTTKLDGGRLTSTSSSTIVDLQGGSLVGSGTITATVQNGALVDPSSASSKEGLLTISGNYTQTTRGTLRADIKGSTTAGTDYDQLAVSGTATLAGKLNIQTVSGFIPKPTDHLNVVTATTRTGTFTTLLHSQLSGNHLYWVQYPSNAAILRVMTSFSGPSKTAPDNDPEYDPPDTIVTKTATHVLEGVNTSLLLTDASGSNQQSQSLLSFFNTPLSAGILFDPRVYFDVNATNPRVIVVAIQTNETNNSTIWLAVSRSPDPSSLAATAWCSYPINAKLKLGTQLTWADFPAVGTGSDALVLTTNQIDFATGQFTYAIVWVMNKTTLENNANSCPALPNITTFQPATSAGDSTIASLQPVHHLTAPSSFTGTNNPIYLVNALETGGSGNIYTVWRVSNVASGRPKLDHVFLFGAFNFNAPPRAPQKGSSVLLQTGDVRIEQAVGLGDTITFSQTTGCTVAGSNQSCVRVVRFSVGQDSSGNPTVTFLQETDVAGPVGTFLFDPGISVNKAGQTVLVYQQSSRTSYLSASWTLMDASATSFLPASPLTTGTCVPGSNTSTGDYTGAATDPSDNTTFWLGGESNGMVGTSCQWKTQVGGVTP